jgi:type I restriction enzyme, S subunit
MYSICDPQRFICYGVIKLGREYPTGIQCLRTSDVKPLNIDIFDVKRIDPKISAQYERTLLKGGEILVNVRGTLGGVAVVPVDLKGWNVSREVAVVPVTRVIPEFIAFWIASIPCQNWLTRVAKGVAYTGINIKDLKRLPVALPSLEEQDEIVKRTKEFLYLADHIEARYKKANGHVERLKNSVLAKAFRGELMK